MDENIKEDNLISADGQQQAPSLKEDCAKGEDCFFSEATDAPENVPENVPAPENTPENVPENTPQNDGAETLPSEAADLASVPAEAGAEAPQKKQGVRIYRVIFNSLLISVTVVLAFLLVFKSIFIYCPVSQTSMFPGLWDGDRVLLTRTKNIKRDEVFVFTLKNDSGSTTYIKRAVGIGGDRLLFVTFGKEGDYTEVFLYRNCGYGWTLLNEDYRNREEQLENKPMILECAYMQHNTLGGFQQKHIYAAGEEESPTSFDIGAAEDAGLLVNELGGDIIITVADGWYFAMGDNRNHSTDSRVFGHVDKNTVEGRLWAKIPRGTLVEKIIRRLYGDTAP